MITELLIVSVVFVVSGSAVVLFSRNNSRTHGEQHYLVRPGDTPVTRVLDQTEQLKMPEYFDEVRICNDLQNIAQSPTIFDMYVQRLWNRFTTDNQRALMEQWIKMYQTGKRLVEADIELQDAYDEKMQRTTKKETLTKEAALRHAQLIADTEEQRLRAQQAKSQRIRLRQNEPASAATQSSPTPTSTPSTPFSTKMNKISALQEQKRQEEERIKNNSALSDTERAEQLDLLEKSFQEEKAKIEVGFTSFED